jgi:hypothetical protein
LKPEINDLNVPLCSGTFFFANHKMKIESVTLFFHQQKLFSTAMSVVAAGIGRCFKNAVGNPEIGLPTAIFTGRLSFLLLIVLPTLHYLS